MRLIDADYLKEHLMTCAINGRPLHRMYTELDDLLIAIDDVPTIEPDPHWISCKERLPKVGQKVVICELDDIISVCRLMESVEGELFWKDDNCRWGVYENYTEWIPLPESFKGRRWRG